MGAGLGGTAFREEVSVRCGEGAIGAAFVRADGPRMTRVWRIAADDGGDGDEKHQEARKLRGPADPIGGLWGSGEFPVWFSVAMLRESIGNGWRVPFQLLLRSAAGH